MKPDAENKESVMSPLREAVLLQMRLLGELFGTVNWVHPFTHRVAKGERKGR